MTGETATGATATYRLTDDQLMLRDAVRVLADERIQPRAAEIDRSGQFPEDVRQLLASHDILALPFPEQYGGLGRAVFVSHGFGLTTVYGHLSRVLVTPGQRVERGASVGLVGNTGRATGYHLHYEVQVDGDSVNPLPFLLAESRSGS